MVLLVLIVAIIINTTDSKPSKALGKNSYKQKVVHCIVLYNNLNIENLLNFIFLFRVAARCT